MSYRAIVTREDRYWLAEVDGLPGAHAYARSLARLRGELADAIILSDDLPDDADFEIEFVSTQDKRLAQLFALASERRELRDREQMLRRQVDESVRSLSGEGWSVRDIAGALDLTPGRVSQLTKRRVKC